MKMSILRLSILCLAITANAQTVLLKTGQKLDSQGIRRDGDLIMAKVQVGTGSGEVGYHVGQIAKIEFPEPAALKTANDLLVRGDAEKALAEINSVIGYYDQFKDVPGSWWAQSALIKVAALAALQRQPEAEVLAKEIQKSVTDPEIARAAQLRLVGALIRRNDFEKAVAICDDAIKNSKDETTLANAWTAKGDALLAQKTADEALMAYLHVPVFYYEEKQFMPAALLGSARAYRRLDDVDHAKKSLNELIASFPQSAEAAAAQTELKKL
jgi:tetratricopeptide (TPR) repeat protein